MLNALTVSGDASAAGLDRAQRSMEQQGFERGPKLHVGGLFVQTWRWPDQRDHADFLLKTDAGFAVCIGPIWYRGMFGIEALQELLNELHGQLGQRPRFAQREMRGNFVLLIGSAERSWLLNDPLGFVPAYLSDDQRFFSTSWLSVRAYVGNSDIDTGAAIEYVLQEAPHSNRTAAMGVSRLPLGEFIEFSERGPDRPIAIKGWIGSDTQAVKFQTPDAAVEWARDYYLDCFAQIARSFAGRTSAALSGGFDSRLILAALLAAGERPELFVYGEPDSDDVRIAHQVADCLAIDLKPVDKQALDSGREPPDVLELERAALFFDGLPNDGIADPGSDRQTRLAQNADGRIALNGGGGEILRNYFHLPDRRYTALDVVRTFYRGFSPAVFRQPGELRRYESELAASMIDTILRFDREAEVRRDSRSMVLSRAQVELLFPLFRCHFWMARNNSVQIRHGHFSTPLVDHNLVRACAGMPLHWKSAGRLQSRVIHALNPAVARPLSAYGFSFSSGPRRQDLFDEWLTCQRPVWARPMINAIRRRLQRVVPDRALVDHYRKLLPGEWRMDRELDLSQLPGNTAFARALAIEVVMRRL